MLYRQNQVAGSSTFTSSTVFAAPLASDFQPFNHVHAKGTATQEHRHLLEEASLVIITEEGEESVDAEVRWRCLQRRGEMDTVEGLEQASCL